MLLDVDGVVPEPPVRSPIGADEHVGAADPATLLVHWETGTDDHWNTLSHRRHRRRCSLVPGDLGQADCAGVESGERSDDVCFEHQPGVQARLGRLRPGDRGHPGRRRRIQLDAQGTVLRGVGTEWRDTTDVGAGHVPVR